MKRFPIILVIKNEQVLSSIKFSGFKKILDAIKTTRTPKYFGRLIRQIEDCSPIKSMGIIISENTC